MELVLFLCLAAAVGAGYLIFRSTEDGSKLLKEAKEEKVEAAPTPVLTPAKKARATKKTSPSVKFASAAKNPTAKSTSRKKKQ